MPKTQKTSSCYHASQMLVRLPEPFQWGVQDTCADLGLCWCDRGEIMKPKRPSLRENFWEHFESTRGFAWCCFCSKDVPNVPVCSRLLSLTGVPGQAHGTSSCSEDSTSPGQCTPTFSDCTDKTKRCSLLPPCIFSYL